MSTFILTLISAAFFNLPACSCNVLGTLNNSQTCDQQTGNCFCKQNIEGGKCNECINGFYLFPTDQESDCLECPCDVGGAYEICEKQTGKSTVLFIVTFLNFYLSIYCIPILGLASY